MTITTADRPVGLFRLAPLALAAMLVSTECRADWKVTPGVALSETYSDNVNNQVDGQARSTFVTEVAPSLNLSGTSRYLKVDGSAQWQDYTYRDNDIPNVQGDSRQYQLNAQGKVIEEFLFVDVRATRMRQAISPYGPAATNTFSSLNNTEISTWTVSPNIHHRFGNVADLSASFTRDSVNSNQEQIGFNNSKSNTWNANLASANTVSDFGWNMAYYRQNLHAVDLGDSATENATATGRYRVLPHLSLTATIEYDDNRYSSLGGSSTGGRGGTLGFLWTPSTVTSVQAAYGHRYFGKTGSLNASHRTRLSEWTLTYSDDVTTTRSQFTLPAAYDTAALLNSMFTSTYPDPTQRAAAVQAYLAASGLPATLTDSINYLSNRYQRMKHLQGSLALRGARNDLLLTVFNDQRNALSLQESDSTLLASQFGALNDNTRQTGVSAALVHRMSSRMTAHADLSFSRVKSLDTEVRNDIRQANLGVERRFSQRVTGTLNLRHTNGRADTTNLGDYHENAIVATLSAQF